MISQKRGRGQGLGIGDFFLYHPLTFGDLPGGCFDDLMFAEISYLSTSAFQPAHLFITLVYRRSLHIVLIMTQLPLTYSHHLLIRHDDVLVF
jgi:hypothetical protein